MNYWTERINYNSACVCVNSLCVVEGKSCVWVSHLLLILQGTGSRILLRYTHTDQIRSFLVCSSSKHTHSNSPTMWLPLLYSYNNAIIRSTVSLPPFLRLENYSTRLQPTVAQSLCFSLMIWKSLNHNNTTRTEATVSQPHAHTHTSGHRIYTNLTHTESTTTIIDGLLLIHCYLQLSLIELWIVQ